ncbi:MAG: hypothetical protein ACM359_09250 [Bacillota bacterium]
MTGSWGESTRWSTDPQVPNNGSPEEQSTYDVFFDAVGSPYRIGLEGDVDVNSLCLDSSDATLLQTRGRLHLAQDLQINRGAYVFDCDTLALCPVIADTHIVVGPLGRFEVNSNRVGKLQNVMLAGKLSLLGTGCALVEKGLTLADGQIVFAHDHGCLQFSGAQELAGRGQILFEGTGDFTSNVMSVVGGPLMIGPEILIKSVSIGASLDAHLASMANHGTIWSAAANHSLTLTGNWSNAGVLKVTVGTLSLNGDWSSTGSLLVAGGVLQTAGNWSNNGPIQVAGGELELGGTFSSGDLGDFTRTGGVVRLVGRLQNQDKTLDLDRTGPLIIDRTGQIVGGTVRSTGDANLVAVFGSLDGVTLDANLRLADEARLSVLNPQPLVPGRRIEFDNNSNGSYTFLQYPANTTISGQGQILFEGRSGHAEIRQDSGTLTIGPDVKITASRGIGWVGLPDGDLVHQGRAEAISTGDRLILQGQRVINSGVIEAHGGGFVRINGRWTNQGSLLATSGTLELGGEFTTVDIGNLERGPQGVVRLAGCLDNHGAVLALDNRLGSLQLTGGGRIVGGTVRSVNGTQLLVPGVDYQPYGVLEDVRAESNISVAGHATLGIVGSVDLVDSRITLGDSSYYSSLEFLADGTLSGSNAVVSFEGPMASIVQTYGQATLGPGLTLQTGSASGQIVGRFNATVVNYGTVAARGSGKQISFDVNKGFTNKGVLEASNGGKLTFWQTVYNAGSLRIDNGTVSGPLVNEAGCRLEGRGKLDMQKGTLLSHGVIAPGFSAGILQIDGKYEQAADGILQIEIGGRTAGTQYDRLVVSGDASLEGTLQVLLLGQPQFTRGNQFDVLTAASIANKGLYLDAPTLPGGLEFDWSIVRYGSQRILRLTVVPEPAMLAVLVLSGGMVWAGRPTRRRS